MFVTVDKSGVKGDSILPGYFHHQLVHRVRQLLTSCTAYSSLHESVQEKRLGTRKPALPLPDRLRPASRQT